MAEILEYLLGHLLSRHFLAGFCVVVAAILALLGKGATVVVAFLMAAVFLA